MPHQESDWTLDDLSPTADEWSLADLATETPERPRKRLTSLTAEEGQAAYKARRQRYGTAKSLKDIAAGVLEGLSAVPTEVGILGEQVGLPGALNAPAALGRGLRGAGESISPPEQRGQGGLLEQLSFGGGQIAGSIPAMAGGMAAKVIQFGAQQGVPLYFDIKAKTGDEEAALWGLLAGNAIGQLEHFGIEGLLSGAVERLAKGAGGKALAQSMLRRALGMAGAGVAETATEVGAQGLSDLVLEALTDEDVDNIERMKAVIPPSLILGTGLKGLIDVVDSAKARRSAVAGGMIDPAGPAAQQEGGFSPTAPREPSAGIDTPAGPAPSTPPTGPVGTAVQPAPLGTAPQPSPAPGPPQTPQAGRLDFPPPTDVAPRAKTVEEVSAEARARTQPELEGVTAPPEVAPDVTPPPDAPAPGEPPAAQAEPQKTTGIKNTVVERELKEMGLPLPEGPERKADLELHARAKAKFDASEGEAGADLVTDLEKNMRPPTDEEAALLVFEANRLKQERAKAEKALLKNDSVENQKAVDAAKAAYQRAANVFDRAGTEQGRSLRARQLMLKHDYSLAEMERQVSIAKGGKDLTKEESAKVKELHERIAAAQAAFDEHMTQAELRHKELEARALLAEAKAFAAKESKKAGNGARRASIVQTKAEIDEILRRLGSSQKAAAGLDPATVGLTLQLAGKYIKLGYQSFDLFAKEVVARVGESIRPYLRTAWDDAQAESDAELLKRYKARKEADIARLGERAKVKAFNVARRRTPVEKDPEAVRLKAEFERAKRGYESEKEKHRRAQRNAPQKLVDGVKEFVRTAKEVLTAYDLSAPFRQGLPYTLGQPIQSLRRARQMFRAMASEKKASEIDAAIKLRKGHDFAEASGLKLRDINGALSETEEHMRSTFAKMFPGVKASNRAFITYLNLQAAENFDRIVAARPTPPTLEEGKKIADGVNAAVGRGTLRSHRAERFINAIGEILWAPRLYLSRIQLLAGTPLLRGDRHTRKAFAADYARFLAGAASIYGLTQLYNLGADEKDKATIETDPRSSDFGKAKIGKTRIDPMGGFLQFITLGARLVTGERKDTKTGRVQDTNRLAEILRFGRYKLAPVPSLAADVLDQETALGEPVTAAGEAKRILLPLAWQDLRGLLEDQGIPRGVAMQILSLFGVGVQVHERKGRK